MELLKSAAEEYAQNNDLYVVEINVSKDNDIDIVIESDTRDIELDDCVGLSRHVEGQLSRDIEDFSLTVGSAGLSSPFTVVRQYRKYVGGEIQIPRASGSRQKAVLESVGEEGIEITYEESVKVEGKKKREKQTRREIVPFTEIKSAKPVIQF